MDGPGLIFWKPKYHRPNLPREGMYFCVIFGHFKATESDSPCDLISTKYKINGKESIARKALVSDINFRAQTSIVCDLQLSATIIQFNLVIVSSLVYIPIKDIVDGHLC